MKPNWKSIRFEYITTGQSYRDLCDKYGISLATLSRRAKREGWPEMRKLNDNKVTAKALEAYNEKEIQKRLDLIEAADVLLERVGLIFTLNPEQLTQKTVSLTPQDVLDAVYAQRRARAGQSVWFRRCYHVGVPQLRTCCSWLFRSRGLPCLQPSSGIL